jgi:hypothetical protein
MKLGIGLSLANQRFIWGGFDPAYQAVLDFATSESLALPNATIQGLQNKLFEAINPFFSKFKEVHLWAGEADLGGFKSIDLVRLNKADYYNSPTFLARGVKGNGTSSYVDLNFDANALTDADSLTFGFLAPDGLSDTSSESVMGGISSEGGISILYRHNNGDMLASVNSKESSFLIVKDELVSISNNGNDFIVRENEIIKNQRNLNLTFKSSNSVYLLARNFNGNAERFTNKPIAFSFISDELTSSELGILSNAVKTYLSKI